MEREEQEKEMEEFEIVEDPFSMETVTSSNMELSPFLIDNYVEDHSIDIDRLQAQHGLPPQPLPTSSNGRRRVPLSSAPLSAPIIDNPPQISVPSRRHALPVPTLDNPPPISTAARRPLKLSKRGFHSLLCLLLLFFFLLWWFFPSVSLEVKDGRMMNVHNAEMPLSTNVTRVDLEHLAMLAVAHSPNTPV